MVRASDWFSNGWWFEQPTQEIFHSNKLLGSWLLPWCINSSQYRISVCARVVCLNYRVSHSDMDFLKWLWGVERLRILVIYLWLHGHEGYPFMFHHPIFKKVASAGLNSLWQNGYQMLVKKLDFWWSIPQKWTSIGNFGARDDPIIRIRKFFDEMRLSRSLRPLRLLRLLRSLRPQRL